MTPSNSKFIFETIDKEPRKIRGSNVPLFDRLIDENPDNPTDDGHGGRFYNREELVASIEREVDRLLNTRTSIKREEYEDRMRDDESWGLPGMYGIPAFSLYDCANTQNWTPLCRSLERAISYYEPRLKDVHVIVEVFENQQQRLALSLSAVLNVNEFQGEVTFPLSLDLTSR